ncbi:MAG: hypothetical protein AB7F35_06480 [Acetobacteraceae bacterium]
MTGRYFVPTGHPPVAERLRSQRRSSTGATYLARTVVQTVKPDDAAEKVSATASEAILEFLRRQQDETHLVPVLDAMPDELPAGVDTVQHVRLVLAALAKAGEIILWVGKTHSSRWSGEWAVRLKDSPISLVSPGAPQQAWEAVQ